MAKAIKPLMTVVGAAVGFVTLGPAGIFVGAYIGNSLGNSAKAILAPKVKAPATSPSSEDRLTANIDLRTPRKIVVGSTAMATDIRDQEWSADQSYLDRFIVVASHRVQAIREIWFDDKLAWSASGGIGAPFAGYLTVTPVLEGSAANAIVTSGRMGASRRFTGCAYVHLRYKLTGNGKKAESPFATTIPSRMTIVGDGLAVYDPRLDSTVGGAGPQRANDQSTWAWTESAGRNPPLQLLTYLLGWRINGKLAVGKGLPAARIDIASFMTAANLCDEPVARSAGGTEPRYRADGIFSEGDDLRLVLDNFKAAMNAELDDADGRIRISILYNDLASPRAALGAADVLGDFAWDQTEALSDTVNIMRGGYTDASAASLYQMVDYPEVRIAAPDGIDRVETVNLPLVQSASQAQRLVKLKLQRALYAGTFTAVFQATAWRYQKGDIVPFTFPPLGFAAKLFRIAEMTIQVDGTVPMTLREEHAAMYAWDATDAPAVQGAQPTAYLPNLWPIVQGIVDAGTTAEWDGVTGQSKPDDNATNSADPTSPFGPGGTVADALDDLRATQQALTAAEERLDAIESGAGEDAEGAAAARAAAEAARDAAIVARNNAQAAVTDARAARDAAAVSKGDAQGFATTASGKADVATQRATAAEQFASTASAKADIASTKAGQAEAAASTAVSSKNDAAGSANTASQQAGLAAQARTDAQGSASAAGQSATVAQTKAGEAGTSASAASQSRLDAQAARDAASSSAGVSQQQAALATDKAAAASQSAGLSAQHATEAGQALASINDASGVFATKLTATAQRASTIEARAPGSGAVNLNPYFGVAGWSNYEPPLWSIWRGDRSLFGISAAAGRYSNTPLSMTRPAGGEVGIWQSIDNLPAGWYVIEAEVELASGSWQGAGVHCNFNNGASIVISFGSEADIAGLVHAGSSYNRRTWSVLVKSPAQSNASFYAMGGWTVFDGLGAANINAAAAFIWHDCLIRPATAGDLKGIDAVARVRQTEIATADLYGRTSARWKVEAIAGGTSASAALIADSGGYSAFVLDTNLIVNGDALFNGTVGLGKLARAQFGTQLSAAWAAGPVTPPGGSTSTLIDATIGQVQAGGSFLLDVDLVMTSNAGTVQTQTLNGKPYYIHYQADGGVGVSIMNGNSRVFGRDFIATTRNGFTGLYGGGPFTGRLLVDISNGAYDSGLINGGDYYERYVSATATISRIAVLAKWTFI